MLARASLLLGPTARWTNPLMGWTSTADPQSQVTLYFDTQDEAIRFATRQGEPLPRACVCVCVCAYVCVCCVHVLVVCMYDSSPWRSVGVYLCTHTAVHAMRVSSTCQAHNQP
jgi:hypothetical protein